MNASPVFYDPTGRRKRRFTLAIVAFVVLLVLAVGALAVTIGAVPRQPLLPVDSEHPALTHLPPPHETLIGRARHRLTDYARLLGVAPPRTATTGSTPLAIAFHAPWDESSGASLQRHIDAIDWLIPAWLSVTGPQHGLTLFADPEGRAILNRATHRPLLLPMVQNALNGQWDTAGAAALFHDPRARTALLDRLEPFLAANQASGAFFDFENLPPAAQPDYRRFLAEASQRFHRRGWIVAIAVPVGAGSGWEPRLYAPLVDRLFLMAYDEHESSSGPGPIASQQWFETSIARAAAGVPRSKLVVAIGNYAYDWHDNTADPLGVEEAWQSARDSDTVPSFDASSGNSGFAYEEGNTRHVVWLLDAASAYNQLTFLHRVGLQDVALWRLGSEDPALWSMFGRDHRTLPPAPAAIGDIPAGTNVDIEGSGEILRIAAVPLQGRRSVATRPDGTVGGVSFRQLPSPFEIVRAGGANPRQLALTFDDGPDPEWTPQILDELKAAHVPATFFIVGENAITQRGLLQRMIAEGHEVGSHTYTHPNLAGASERETAFQLNTTQRLFQAFTGRSLRLFRAPYFGDAEPTTADEIGPALQAQNLGYISVGLHVDPGDWRRPGVQEIVDQTIAQVLAATPDRSANVILLHDAGGDRSQTVAALPEIIRQLQARGYGFVPVSALAGISPIRAMPPIAAGDRMAATADLVVFETIGWLIQVLGWLFLFAISIGIARALILSALALRQARREQRTVFPAIDPATHVTVLIPAFNEEAVIARAVAGVLASREVEIEVIVIDDGSADRTGEIVRTAYADDPRVRLLTLENGGKARALNRGLELATSDIVVALDADTRFEPATIARLARWFVDPKLGAVAGNAKVGNRVNLITRWQALEYITAQNLERRALASLNAMTVVPGAVGAWRRSVIAAVGGYPDDTLAEDQDLTIAIQRAGWCVTYDQYAVAWTESPESFRGLAKQRFRWAFGTLQCLWKHGGAIGRGRPRGLAWIGLPQAILFQILLAAISPIIDLALLLSFVLTWFQYQAHGWEQTSGDLERMAVFWVVFTLIDLLSATIAFALERRERWRLLWLLIPQRIGYRQIMYYVVLKAITQATRGPLVGWGKLKRTGRVTA